MNAPTQITPLDELRDMAREWAAFVCALRKPSDPVYKWVTEGRDPGPQYSSCGDLAHFILYRLGCREPWINRKEHLGWKPNRNVNRLVRLPIGTNELAREPIGLAQTGDILVIWQRADTSDAHVLVVDRMTETMLDSFDMGQGPLRAEAWKLGEHVEAKHRERPLVKSGSEYRTSDGRALRSLLSLDRIPFTAEPDLPTGERFDELEGLLPKQV